MAVVDVLIPAYNAATTIRSAVESIQRQTLEDILIHVVDDGSTDATPEILADMAAADPRLRVHTKPNGGIVEALNFGLRLCTAEFVARHDADDFAYPERLAIQVDYLRGHPDVVAVGAAVRHIDIHDQPTGSFGRLASPDLADPFSVPSKEPYLIHPFLTARRSAMETAGGYRAVHHAEDTDLYWRLRDQGRLHNLPDLLGDYRLHDGSISGGSIANGRIMAISSQLAAVSARRRQRGFDDLVFDKAQLAAYKKLPTLEAMIDYAAAKLDPAERDYLREAVAAKLVELTGYRPYELDAEDCRFIGGISRRGFRHLNDENRQLLERQISGTAARLAASGQMSNALRLLPARLLPKFLARYLARVVLPGSMRRSLRRGATKNSPVK